MTEIKEADTLNPTNTNEMSVDIVGLNTSKQREDSAQITSRVE